MYISLNFIHCCSVIIINTYIYIYCTKSDYGYTALRFAQLYQYTARPKTFFAPLFSFFVNNCDNNKKKKQPHKYVIVFTVKYFI